MPVLARNRDVGKWLGRAEIDEIGVRRGADAIQPDRKRHRPIEAHSSPGARGKGGEDRKGHYQKRPK